MKTAQMTPSKYLKKEDFPRPQTLTIRSLGRENVAMADQPEALKYILYFHETTQGMVLGRTTIEQCELACGTDETDEWPGHAIVVYNDPTVMFGPRRTGGLRIRAAANSARRATRPAPSTPMPPPSTQSDEAGFPDDSDVPY